MLQLPVELKLVILRQLPGEDLFTLLSVSKQFKPLVHPVFYERMAFTKAGFAFAHAPNPYPFLNIPNLKGQLSVSDEEREAIMKGIRQITVAPHDHAWCTGWQTIQTSHLPARAEVLKIELAYPYRDGMACCHKPDICGGCPVYEDEDEDHIHPHLLCGFIAALANVRAKKIVITNFPALLNGASPLVSLPTLAKNASEMVIVLKPHTLEDTSYREGPYFANLCPDGDKYLGASALMNMIPAGVKHLTLVFYTSYSNAEWAPYCKHYEYDWYQDGCVTPCPCGGGCHGGGMSFGDDMLQQSCWQSAFWIDLASGMAASKAHITIVNYSAIIPDGLDRYEALRALDKGKRSTVRKTILRQLRKAHASQEEYEARAADIAFVSMESWIRSGAWEDVFGRKEINRWIARIEKLESKAKSSPAMTSAVPTTVPAVKPTGTATASLSAAPADS